jgi:hypothetical protein
MIQRREGSGLPFEPRQPFGIRGEHFGQDLDGDVAPEPGRSRDTPHSALANQGDDQDPSFVPVASGIVGKSPRSRRRVTT